MKHQCAIDDCPRLTDTIRIVLLRGSIVRIPVCDKHDKIMAAANAGAPWAETR